MILAAILLLAWATLPSGNIQAQTSSHSTGSAVVIDSPRGNPVILAPLPQTGTGTAAIPSPGASSWLLNSQTSTAEVSAEASLPNLVNLFPLPKNSLFMQRRRNKLEIYAEILRRLIADPLGITEIALFCRLNFSTAKEMVDYLISLGLLKAIEMEDDLRYATTRKGILSLQDIERVSSLFHSTVNVP